MLRSAAGAWFAALIALVGCDRDRVVGLNDAADHPPAADRAKFVHVHVVGADGGECIVNAQQMRCDAVATYLKDNLHVGLSETIAVDPDATGRAAIAGAEGVRAGIEAAGYSDVWIVGFLTSPDHPNPDP